MTVSSKHHFALPPEQQAIRDKCFHPNGKFVEFAKEEIEQSIPERFEEIVRKFANRVAVKTSSSAVTYEELNARANGVAQALLARRAKRAEPLALVLDHGLSMVIGLLGALKTGRIVLPLDPALPNSRIIELLRDAQAPFLLCSNRSRTKALELRSFVEDYIDIDQLPQGTFENPKVSIRADDLATIVYTSGSSGKAKGVVQNHRNTLFEVRRLTHAFHVTSDDRMSHLLACTVIGGLREVFAALLNGAVLYPFSIREQGFSNLADFLRREAITICRFVSTPFEKFADTLASDEQFPSVRILYIGGEPVLRRHVELYERHFSSICSFVNVYGATETGLVRDFFIDKNTRLTETRLPIGFATEEMETLLLNEKLQAVEFDEIGEIAVRSRFLSPGYWRNADLTKTVFLPVPDDGENRIYLTGDLGRMTPDNCLEHLGRKDLQVKIRGFRIEVAEIETALLNLSNIKTAAVVVREDRPGEKRLMAYIVPHKKPSPSVKSLRHALAEKLPSYMVPTTFVPMDALPLLHNGKLDRNALPLPDHRRPALGDPYIPPRNEVEQRLAEMWAEVLSVDRVGIQDNFFELGGHSLLAVRMVSEVQKRLGKHIPVAALFSSPTIAELASVLRIQKKAVPSPLIVVQPNGSQVPFFCAHGTDSYGQLARYLGPDQPIYGLAQHLEGRKVRHTRFEDIAAHYLRKIRMVQPQGPYYIGGHSMGGLIAFEMAQQLQQQGQGVALLVLFDSASPWILPSGTNDISDESMATQFTPSFSIRSLKRDLYFLRHRAKETLQEETKTVACHLYHRLGMPLPPTLQTFYVDQVVYGRIYPEAHRSYVPQTYSGRVVYFKSEDTRERVAGWKKLMNDGLEIRQVPGNHLSMLAEPNLRSLALTLKECLAKAQESARTGTLSFELSSQTQCVESPQ